MPAIIVHAIPIIIIVHVKLTDVQTDGLAVSVMHQHEFKRIYDAS